MPDQTGAQDVRLKGWTQVQDSGSPPASLIGEKQRKNGGAHTISSLISHMSVIWSRLKECVCVCVCDVMPGKRRW